MNIHNIPKTWICVVFLAFACLSVSEAQINNVTSWSEGRVAMYFNHVGQEGPIYSTPSPTDPSGDNVSLSDNHTLHLAPQYLPWISDPDASLTGSFTLNANVISASDRLTISGQLDSSAVSYSAKFPVSASTTRSNSFVLTTPHLYHITCAGNAFPFVGGVVGVVSLDRGNYGRIFRMGRGALYGGAVPSKPVPMSGLLPPGLYDLSAQASSGSANAAIPGSSSSSIDFTFSLRPQPPPAVLTLPVSNLTQSSATLNGVVNPNGTNVSVRFEYGLESLPNYTHSIDLGGIDGVDSQRFSRLITGLTPNVPYRYHIVAQSGELNLDGGEKTFTPTNPAAPDNTGADDHDPGCDSQAGSPASAEDQQSKGMATYSFHTKLASLKITDTPVGHDPPYGPAIPFTVTYTQRTNSQPANFNFTNLGPKWNINWLAYITDDPSNVKSVLGQVRPGGGRLPALYLGSDSLSHRYQLASRPHLELRRPIASPLPFEVANSDGSKEVYGQAESLLTAPRRVFLTQRVDSMGNSATLTYDGMMRIEKIIDALGRETLLSYDLGSDPFKVTKVTDPFGRFATFDYDTSERLVKITDVAGIQSSFTYEGSSDFINSMTTPYGTTTFTNFENGTVRRVTATDPAGDTEVMESNSGQTAAIPASETASSLPQGMTVSNSQLDQRNSIYWNKKQWKEGANDYSKAHIYHWMLNGDLASTSGSLESEKPPFRARVWYGYPDQLSPTVIGSITTPSRIGRGIEGGTQLEARTISPQGKVVTRIDPLGRATNYRYDSDGIDLLDTSQTVSGAPQMLGSSIYDDRHLPLVSINAAGQVTTYTWNSVGQIASVTNAKNEITTFSYYPVDDAGRQRKGRLSSIDGALQGSSDTVSFDYDATGNLASVSGPDGYALAFTYDSLDRLTRTTYPDGTYTETIYEALHPKTTRDRMGRITTYVYNSIRQLTSLTDPANRTIQYRWCKCGALQQLIDAMGRITNWRYDAAGLMTAKIYADGSKITYAYEPLSGRLSAVTDEKKQVKTRSYNLDDTLAGIAYTHEEHQTPDVVFTYDTAFRRLKTMLDGIGTTTYAYLPIAAGTLGAGQLASVDGPLPDDTLAYTYDELDRNTGYAINGVGETRTLDALGRLLYAVNPLGYFGYSYVGATSRMDKVTYPNGMTCQYNYHPLAGDLRLKDIIHTLPGNTQLSRHSYEYTAVGNINRWTQISPQAGLNRSWLCGYDTSDQLTSVASQDPDTLAALPTGQYGYTYDLAGNRLTETIDGGTATASFNALNQLTSLTTAEASTLPQQTYEWDAEDRLSAINYVGTNERSEFEYDGLGRRLGVREKQGAIVADYRRFVWESLEMREERAATGSTIKRRYFQRGMQILGNNGALDVRMFSHDHLGSVRQMTSAAAATTSTYNFDPWGKRAVSTGQAEESNLAFTGLWLHDRSNLATAFYRAYNVGFARWLTRDPIEENGGENLYQYVRNGPVESVDPLGLDVWVDGSVHQRISIGNPFGEYRSFSFMWNPTILNGIVFEDFGKNGAIDRDRYLKTSPELDKQVIGALENIVGQRAGYGVVFDNCRTFSQDGFDAIRKALGDRAIPYSPSQRPNTPHWKAWAVRQ